MSIQLQEGTLAEFIQPNVNPRAGGTKIDFGDPNIVVYGAATAGKSRSINFPVGPLDVYNDLTGFMGAYVPNPDVRRSTGYVGVIPWIDDAYPGKAEARITFVGALEGFKVLPVQVPLFLWHTNVTPVGELAAARRYTTQARVAALHEIQRQLDKEKAAFAQRSIAMVVTELTDQLGMSQLVLARALNVSPTAIRKWRRGEAARPEHRDALASLGAFARVLEHHVHDPAGWIEIPISGQATVTPLDLFEAKRPDLAVLFAAGVSDPDETLTSFVPDWRERFEPDGEYEVVRLKDGSRSAVPRVEGHH